MSNRYLITLKPLEPFFFGGEQTFGEGESVNYFAKSMFFPQQTTLLGMLRKEILIKEGLLTKKIRGEWIDKPLKEKAKKLIGNTKFSLNQDENFKNNNFGVIKSISSVFLEKENDFFILVKDFFKYDVEIKEPIVLKGFTAKDGIDTKFIDIKDFNNQLKFSDVFEEVIQVGNRKIAKAGKSFTSDDKKDGFFKKLSFNLKNRIKFAFLVDSSYNLEKLNDNIVFLGADRGKFLINVTQKEDINLEDNRVFPFKSFSYIILLSDSYLKKPLKELCKFAITSEVTFKFLQNDFTNGKRKLKKSNLYYFYEKGSIFIDPTESFYKDINKNSLIQIGYNKFIKKEVKC